MIQSITTDIKTKNELKEMLAKELEKHTGAKEDYEKQRKELDYYLEKEKQVEINFNKIAEKKRNIQQMLSELELEIENKEKITKDLQKLQQFNHWLTEFFIGLTDNIEKHVMSRVYTEFNELFQAWFRVLVEDELLNARLDDSFAPVITQNGYDMSVDNLSGGEKTACALAYRLALNKVINEIISGINTKNILILDEPTDGFSEQQLDKMRDVLSELNAKQVILVSHEGKIESFVDSVLRVNKHEHISRIEA